MLRVKRPLKTSRLARHLLFQQRQVGTDIRMSAIELRSTSVTGRRARSDVEPPQSTHCRRSMRRGCGGSFQGTTAIQSVTLADGWSVPNKALALCSWRPFENEQVETSGTA